MRLFGDPKPGMPVCWWHPLAVGFVASLMWAVTFSTFATDANPGRVALLAAVGVAFTALVARNGGSSLKVRGRLWLGSTLFGLGHIPALGLAHLYIWKTAAPAYPLLLIYLAAFPALTAFLASRVSARCPRLPAWAVVPFIWVALEYVRGEWLIGGYPWYLLGHALTADGGPPWPAKYIGAYGCSLLLALVACGAVDAIGVFARLREQGSKSASTYGMATIVVIVMGVGLLRPFAAPLPARNFRIAILQTNLPQDNKIGWAMAERVDAHNRWLTLTAKAAEAGATSGPNRAQLVVWPETMFPGFALNPDAIDAQRRAGLTYGIGSGTQAKPLAATWFADTLTELQARVNTPFLIGAIGADGLRFSPGDSGRVKTDVSARTNSAFLVTDGRVQAERYDKMDLMAFGEYIPVVYRWPGVQSWLTGLGAQGMTFDLAFGKQRTLFNIEGVRIGTPICFEVCHESSCREFTTNANGTRRADLLVNITNDGWFYGSDFNRRMHLLQARWRCAELATPMARAANTGISCIIDSAGKVLTPTLDDATPSTQSEGVLTADIPLLAPDAPPTFYATAGHYLNIIIVLRGAWLTFLALWPGLRRTPAPTPA